MFFLLNSFWLKAVFQADLRKWAYYTYVYYYNELIKEVTKYMN